MSLYERIREKQIIFVMPECYVPTAGQMMDLKTNAPDTWELMTACFEFGYMQGARAAKADKAENI